MKRGIGAMTAIVAAMAVVSGCGGSQADTVNHNLGVEAERFAIVRRIVVTNDFTDKVQWEVTGRCSLEQNLALPRNLEIICKDGPGDYKKHFIGLADNESWASTQVGGVNVSEFHSTFIFRPQSIIPDVDIATGK